MAASGGKRTDSSGADSGEYNLKVYYRKLFYYCLTNDLKDEAYFQFAFNVDRQYFISLLL